MSKNYIPQKQDLVWLDFDPSAGREIQKRRPALVISSQAYARQTGFVAVCPITHGQEKL
ncbi:transcriptional regulator [Streptococcus mutans ST1]|jgi:transcriptional regulator|nr:transcriptional regulator [Streptococcus mutans ST1]